MSFDTASIKTHKTISNELCGCPELLEDGVSRVVLLCKDNMSADESGLTHGGFIFGLADYAAMIAVNHPNVVLGSSEVRFLKPVKTGETVVAEAKVAQNEGKKRIAEVVVTRGEEKVFEGTFTCFVLDRHVLG